MLAQGFSLFVVLSLAVMIGILLWTTDHETWHYLSRFQWFFIPLILVLAVLRWFLDGMAFVTMAKHGSESSISIHKAAIIRLEGTLVSSVVPILVGTFSMHAYLLHKQKLRLHESIAITVLRSMLPVFLFLLNIPILFYMRSDPNGGKFFTEFIKTISLPVVGVIVFFIYALFYPEKIKSWASRMVRWYGKHKKKHIDRVVAFEKKLFTEIDQFSQVFWEYLRKKKMMMVEAAFWICLAFIADYLIALVILWGFGYHPPFLKAIAIQFLMRPIIYFAMTPGGAGIWEFTYLGFFSLYMPQQIIGISVLIWRLLVTYLPCVAGAFFLAKELNHDADLKAMIIDRGELPDEELGMSGEND